MQNKTRNNKLFFITVILILSILLSIGLGAVRISLVDTYKVIIGKTFGTYKSQLQEVALNLIGYTNKATGTSGLTLENLVSINPSIIIYVTSDRNQVNDATAVENLLTNEIISEVPAILNKKIIAVTYDEFMDYGPALIDSIVKISEQENA